MAKPTPTQTAAATAAAAALAQADAQAQALAELRRPSEPLPVDEFHGVGGSYVLEGGVRRRVEGPALPEAAAPAQP